MDTDAEETDSEFEADCAACAGRGRDAPPPPPLPLPAFDGVDDLDAFLEAAGCADVALADAPPPDYAAESDEDEQQPKRRTVSSAPAPRASRRPPGAPPPRRDTGAHMKFDAAGEEHAALARIVAATPRRKPDRRSPNGICWVEINRKVMAGKAGPLLQRRVRSVQSKVLAKRWFQFGPPEDYPNRSRIVR